MRAVRPHQAETCVMYPPAPLVSPKSARAERPHETVSLSAPSAQRAVGIANSAPSRALAGQRCMTDFWRV
jgi:hypothetical protein